MVENGRSFIKESLRLSNRSAIVTGAASGIGQATARLFAEQGASVLIADINEQGGQETVDLITADGGNAVFIKADVTNLDDVRRMAAATIDNFGGINILVNNAAAFVFGKIEDVTPEDWQKVLGVNVIGYANCVQAVLPEMKKAGGGAIVNIASVSSFIAQPEFIPYNTSKGAILQLTRVLAMDLAKHDIRVNSICPGEIRTQATDKHIEFHGYDPNEALKELGDKALLKRMGTPLEVANGVLFLASDEASFITGTQLVIDGGATID